MLKVKEYLKERSGGNINERINQAFAQYLFLHRVNFIQLKPDEQDCSTTKLDIRFSLSLSDYEPIPYALLCEIHTCLFDIFKSNDDWMHGIILKELVVTPEIMDVYNNNQMYRGILAILKYR